jgi:hypothetical protein
MSIFPHLTCPKHGFAYVSMPRCLEEHELDSGRFIAKCPLKWCFHGLQRPIIGPIENVAFDNNGAVLAETEN